MPGTDAQAILLATQNALNEAKNANPDTIIPEAPVTPPAPADDDDMPLEPKKPEPPVTTPEPKKEAEPKDPEPTKPLELDKKFKPVAYERFKEVNDKYKALQDQIKQSNEAKKGQEPDDEDTAEQKANLKRLGFVSKEDQEQAQFQMQEQSIRQEEQEILAKEVKSLEKEFDGSDGLPKFVKDDVLAWGMENQVFDPKSAYIVMNLQTIVNHLVSREVAEIRKQPIFGKNNNIQQPDITPKDKLSSSDGSLTKHLTGLIGSMMGK